jgi:hypothetical protein
MARSFALGLILALGLFASLSAAKKDQGIVVVNCEIIMELAMVRAQLLKGFPQGTLNWL